MIPERINNTEFDQLIREALESNDELMIHPDVAERAIRRIENLMLLRELVFELSLKIGLVLACLATLTGVLIWARGSNIINRWYNTFLNYRETLIPVLILVVCVILIDQIILRFYGSKRKLAGWKN